MLPPSLIDCLFKPLDKEFRQANKADPLIFSIVPILTYVLRTYQSKLSSSPITRFASHHHPLRSILQRLRQMCGLDALLASQICNRA